MSAADQLQAMAERIAELEAQVACHEDTDLLDALERMALLSAAHGEPVVLDLRSATLGVVLTHWPDGAVTPIEATGHDLRAAIRAALDGEPADE